MAALSLMDRSNKRRYKSDMGWKQNIPEVIFKILMWFAPCTNLTPTDNDSNHKLIKNKIILIFVIYTTMLRKVEFDIFESISLSYPKGQNIR